MSKHFQPPKSVNLIFSDFLCYTRDIVGRDAFVAKQFVIDNLHTEIK